MVLAILGLQYRLWIGEGSFSQAWQLKNKVELQIKNNDIVEQRNERLNAEVLDLKNGYDAIEEQARFNLGMIGQDETFYIVVTSAN